MTRKVARKNRSPIALSSSGVPAKRCGSFLVELVPEQHTERGPDRAERQGAEQPAGDLADPFHGHVALRHQVWWLQRAVIVPSTCQSLPFTAPSCAASTRIHEGKVRDIYAVDDDDAC